ncbi:MAG: prephenate/arogenate dehydrogenase family protein [Alphaproteobacteria bacterium]|nr:prephenate/arogenate dehydrogenase family protein [Alphaproteobacteria bacterium]
MGPSVLYERIALIGIGLINSSIARAVIARSVARSLCGCAQSEATRRRAIELNLVEQVTADPAEAVREADLVILGTPVGAFGAIARRIGPALKKGATVTDVGSVKAAVVRDVAPHLPAGVHFVPAHPVAGTEHSGPDAGFAELFDKRWCILTPPAGTERAAVDRLSEFWRRLGSKVDVMDPVHHDLVLAITSHLPHLIAYNIVGTAKDLETVTEGEVIKYAAGGFRDFTRIAASDPVMWRDVFLHNREAVLEMLGRFNEDLSVLTRAIRSGDGASLEAFFARTRAIRRGVIDAGQADPEDLKKQATAAAASGSRPAKTTRPRAPRPR